MDGNEEPRGGGVENVVLEVVQSLRRSGAAVSFIEADERIDLPPPVGAADALSALDRLLDETTVYRRKSIMGSAVVYPSSALWEHTVAGISIVDVPRFEAASEYAKTVRARVGGLEDFAGPVMKGDPRSPVFTQPVSLSPSSSVVSHLVELLGSDDALAFTVRRSYTRAWILDFERVAAA